MWKFVLLLIVSIVLYSCVEPSGKNYVEIDAPDAAGMSINLNGISSDTIFIDRDTEFKYEVNGYPVYTTYAEAKLDNTPIYINYGSSGSGLLTIYPKTFKSGVYKLTIKLTGRPNNESLANRVDEEHIYVNGEYILKIDSDPPTPVQITKLDTTKGRLTIEWKKYEKKNFISYQVIKCFNDFNNCQYVDINDNNTTSWTDTDYVGGKVTYEVRIKTTLWEILGVRKEYNWSPGFLTTITNGIATIKWNNTPFYLNTTKTTIRPPVFSNEISFETNATANTYTTPEKLNFGPGYKLSLKLYSNRVDQSVVYDNFFYVGVKHELPYANVVFPILYNSKADLYYGKDGNQQFIITNNKLEVINTVYTTGTLSTSDNGEYFITLLDNKLYHTNPLTLATTLVFTTGSYGGQITVADNGLVGYYEAGMYKVKSLIDGEVKFIDEPSVSSYSQLSRTGNYIISRDQKVYHYNGSNFIYEGTLQKINRSIYEIKFGKNDNLFTGAYYNDGSSKIDFVEFDISSRNVVRSIPFTEGRINFQVDPVTGKILLYQGSAYNFLIDTNGVSKKITKSSFQMMSIFDNTLFAASQGGFFSIECSYVENQ